MSEQVNTHLKVQLDTVLHFLVITEGELYLG